MAFNKAGVDGVDGWTFRMVKRLKIFRNFVCDLHKFIVLMTSDELWEE